jgi:hypothetical protein
VVSVSWKLSTTEESRNIFSARFSRYNSEGGTTVDIIATKKLPLEK